ncbi:WD40 repeat domain-containing protein [Novipirellula artificiosorum]|uniref:WD domain, G-beta repeat n=1 Tax=Novipirellula artificiosorum TaxID=2528016 RepID=A0A5C6DMY2_9BACT|nr:WD40 repeat domain-containing protein [Novipirellula artificiosorum]TWU36219.1 WD domain, G-beta repeat [Novipirellula artificiosorum]
MKRRLSRRQLLGVISASAAAMGVCSDVALLAQPPRVVTALAHETVSSRAIRLEPLADRTAHVVVTAVASDPRGQWLAVAGDDHVIRILEVATLRVTQTLQGHRDLVRTLAFDSTGNSLVSAGNDGQLIVWDRARAFEMVQRMQDTPALACVRFAPGKNEMAAVGFDRKVYILGRPIERTPQFSCDCNDLRAVAYRDDSQMIAVGGRSGDLHLFDPDTGNLIADKHLHEGRIRDLVFHHDANRCVTVGEDGKVVVYDTEKQEIVQQLAVTTGRLFTVAVIDSQHVAVAGSDNTIRIVNTDDGTVRHALQGHVGSISTLTASGGMLFSGGFDATLRRWSISEMNRSQQRIAEGDLRIDR